MSERKKILWLAEWYPNDYDSFEGDFIQRHARAAARYHDIYVLFIKQFWLQPTVETSEKVHQGLTEKIIYLPKRKGLFGKMVNYTRWKKKYKKQVRLLHQKNNFDLIHVHVPWKAGLIALWAKKHLGLPYLVTEHWGIYNRVVEDNLHARPFYVRRFLKEIYTNAAAFVSVSEFLGKAVNETLVKKDFCVVPNVVDTSVFYPIAASSRPFTFLHVSNMVPLKNVDGILAAFKSFLAQTNADARLILIGNKDDHYPLLAKEMSLLNNRIFFKGEIPYPQVAGQMQQSSALLLNSNIENSPCVIGEALCCGLVVVATNVGGIPELINETNGLLVPPQNTPALTSAMVHVYKNPANYCASEIAAAAQRKFSMAAVGEGFSAAYRGFLL